MKAYLVCLLSVSFMFFSYDCQDLQIDPFSIAYVTIGESLTLTCNYTGNNTPVIIRWFLNTDTTGMMVSKATCNIIGTPGTTYEVSRYGINCFKLTITNITENDIDDVWGCTVDFTLGSSPNVSRTRIKAVPTTIPTTTPTTSTTTSTTTTVTSSSTSISSATSSVTIHNTSTNPTTNGSAASTTISTSTSVSSTSVSPANNTNITSTSTKPTISESTTTNNTTGNKSKSDIDIKVIVPAIVVPCGLLIIGGLIIVVCCVWCRSGKNVHKSPDGIAIQDKGNNIEGWKQSQGHGNATDNLDTVYTTPDGFVIFPGPAAMSTARSYKDKKHHGVTDQYSRPYAGPYHHQAEYFPSTYTSARAYTHNDKKHHGVTDQYSRPYTGTYGYQARYVPSTNMSARTYPHKDRKYDYEGPIHQQASHLMATSRPVYGQTPYYPQTGYFGQGSQDVYYSGGRQYFYGQSSKSHHDHNGRKQKREYYNQYEMADYGGNRTGYKHTKQDTDLYY